MEDTVSEEEGTGAQLSADEQVKRIIEAAEKLGVEVDETDAAQWLTAIAATQSAPGDLAVDAQTGIFGHRITLLDFDPTVLVRYRRLADIVQIPDRPGVETAISLSGSAAQSKVQLFPGDADFFERVNIVAPTREESCRVAGNVIRDKALAQFQGENYDLVEVKWGTFQQDVIRDGETIKAGKSISWDAEEVQRGYFEVQTLEGEPLTIDWAYGSLEPGWCKLDWVIAEPEEGRVVHASNMLDVTWETPDGDIVPLDGFLDPYFQEVYLEAQSIPLFTKVVKHLTPDVLQNYVTQLKHEVVKYSQSDPKNFGKVAKRLYNIFRLTGHWSEAAYIRELFDEPAALLYQVGSLLDTIDEAVKSGSTLDHDAIIDQTDSLIRSVVRVLEGEAEEELVDALLRLRDDLSGRKDLGESRERVLAESYDLVGELVNKFFRERLFLMPEIVAYLQSLSD
jgi:hypothetical protein